MPRGGPMQTAWSAKRTWRLARSASEYTATVLMPSSLQAQMTRSAISPRFAIRILLNISARRPWSGPDREEGLAVLHGLPALVMDLHDLPRHLGLDLVHELHGLDDAQHLPDADAVSHAHEGRGVGIRRAVEGADDRALDHGEAGLGGRSRGRRRRWRSLGRARSGGGRGHLDRRGNGGDHGQGSGMVGRAGTRLADPQLHPLLLEFELGDLLLFEDLED